MIFISNIINIRPDISQIMMPHQPNLRLALYILVRSVNEVKTQFRHVKYDKLKIFQSQLFHKHYYPLAQRSCGGDMGSVLYVRMYVRPYVHLSSSV